ISAYIKKGKLWEAFESDEQQVLLIDEIDKADIEFPNDLLQELDQMAFYCYELDLTVKAKHRPIVVITSNNEKELPDAFLRRCFFHYISFPDRQTMLDIVDVHFPKLDEKLVSSAMRLFYELRDTRGIRKKPSTSELLDWISLLIAGGIGHEDLDEVKLSEALPPLTGALLKNEQDYEFLNRIRKYRS
ncbi:MAG: MoxR family ATPase, partial [Calditrichota bacterium]